VIFRRSGPQIQCEKWLFKGQTIETVNSYCYLGTYFTPTLSWTKTEDTLTVQATKTIFVRNMYQKQFGYFTYDSAFKLFDSMIVPILTYSAEIWGYEYSSQIEKAQITYCKRLAFLHQNVANFVALAECGCPPLATIYMTRCVKLWVKLVQMPEIVIPDSATRCSDNLTRVVATHGELTLNVCSTDMDLG